MTAQPRTRPGRQARPGDVTGRKREELAREHSEEIKAREGEISLLTQAAARSVDEDIIDLETREVINANSGAVTRMDEDDDDDDAPRLIGSSTATMQIEELPDPQAQAQANGVVHAQTVEYLNEKVVVRINTDLEDITLGYGNTFTFLEGRRYRVPRWVASWLDERGLTW
jgi:hypothetical protein